MSSPAAPAGNILRRFRRNHRGSAVVEFALVAPIFFGLLFAIIELALVFFASQMLETVTQDSARTIMTGQAQNGQVTGCSTPCTQAQFKDLVCSKITMMFDCVNGISIDVQSYSAFGSVNIASPIDASKNFVAPNNYLTGGPNDIVVVRIFYKWPLVVTGLGFNIANLSGSKRLLTATAAFQNEPY
ncbi:MULTISPECIES: TadE/TadG family type IV pilus assembly protein [Bradyrhizobium]|jgi:Flp pilus assembly protein TadG|uniref:Flp pilus assembly protein TadG n=2 Tax=Bradyrhizobium TaxID=374 RepID=A0ABY0PWE4_9BRAD|nr:MULTISPECIES: TadE/TadG family type IV pilus assembly protein [Bradyrhizobium]SDJ06534.1 Flp pilus assembly protein TadG [Bradyrhizobium ottawaense]SEC96733.1 Flp pilus assembly protein TadG [Bradyrhizobium lablabi]SHL03764.1 Flp pilus assembly protein TadG [Bradyrhizobium lablabi]